MPRQPLPQSIEASTEASDVLAMGFHTEDFPVVTEAWRAARAGEMPHFPDLGPVRFEGLSWTPGVTIRDPARCFLLQVEAACQMRAKFGSCWYLGDRGANRGAAVCEVLWQLSIWWRGWSEAMTDNEAATGRYLAAMEGH